MAKTAVIILNWNGRQLLEQFLPSVIKYSSKEATVVVADNGSEDDSVDFVKRNYPEVVVLEFSENYGFTGGYNKAIKELEVDYALLLNSDVEVTEGWLTPLIKCLDENGNVAACGPKILDYKQKDTFEYAGAAGGFIDKYGFPFCRGRVFTTLEKDAGQYNDPKECLWVSGAALMVRKQLFVETGGLDERFFAHMEEIDFCWRMLNMGYKIVNIPTSVIYHVGGASLSAYNPRKTYLNFRNSLYCLYKNTPPKHWTKSYSVRILLDGIAAIKFLITDGLKHTMAVVKAHRHFMKNMKLFKEVRQHLNNTGAYKKAPIHRRSLVLDYYLRGKKNYSDLEP